MTEYHHAELRLVELEAIERYLAFAEKLRPRREFIIAELEALTKPAARIATAAVAPRGRGYWWGGEFFPAGTKIEVYLATLRRIWQEFPESRNEIASRVKAHSRAYVALAPTALFTGWPERKAKKFSTPLVYGWYADTNVGQEQMARVLRIAGGIIGQDIRVVWQ